MAEGRVALGLAPVSEILSEPEDAFVGYGPAALKEMAVLSAAIAAGTANRQRAHDFVAFLSGAYAQEELAQRGLT